MVEDPLYQLFPMAEYLHSERDEKRLEKIIDITTGTAFIGTSILLLTNPNITQPLKTIYYTLIHYLP